MVWEIFGLGASSLAIVAAVIGFIGIALKNQFVLAGAMVILTYWVYQLKILPIWIIIILGFILILMIKDLKK